MPRSLVLRFVKITSAVACAVLAYVLLGSIHAFERFSEFAGRYEAWQLDDATLVVVLAAILGAVVLAFRRGRALAAARAKLGEAGPASVVCAVCGRDEFGHARPPGSTSHSFDGSTAFTHTVCASCLSVLQSSPAPRV